MGKIIASCLFCCIMFGCSVVQNKPVVTIEQKVQDVKFYVKQTTVLTLYNSQYPKTDWDNLRDVLVQAKNLLTQPDQVDLSVMENFLDEKVPERYKSIVGTIFGIVENYIHTISPRPADDDIAKMAVSAIDGALEAIDEYFDNQ